MTLSNQTALIARSIELRHSGILMRARLLVDAGPEAPTWRSNWPAIRDWWATSHVQVVWARTQPTSTRLVVAVGKGPRSTARPHPAQVSPGAVGCATIGG